MLQGGSGNVTIFCMSTCGGAHMMLWHQNTVWLKLAFKYMPWLLSEGALMLSSTFSRFFRVCPFNWHKETSKNFCQSPIWLHSNLCMWPLEVQFIKRKMNHSLLLEISALIVPQKHFMFCLYDSTTVWPMCQAFCSECPDLGRGPLTVRFDAKYGSKTVDL